ncbi:MAG: FtsX-like permease family protein [Gammaproteobacteria bacterium]|nr:FtsX-like permease family protein [Gammaproteobacteria bacterium]
MEYLRLSLRNIFRHRTRSIATIMVIFLGFTAIGVIGGMVNNIFSRLKAQAIIVEKLGHLTISKEGFYLNGKMDPAKYIWGKDELREIIDVVRDDPDVEIATPRLKLFGLASNGKASSIFISEAIVPSDDERLIKTPVDNRVDLTGTVTLPQQQGEEYSVAIGSELSSMLGVGEGQFVTLLTTTVDGMANAVDVNIVDVYNTGNPATNDKFILMNFGLAQQLYDADGAERIIVTLKNSDDIEKIRARLINNIAASGHSVEVMTWNELSLFYEKVYLMFSVIFGVLSMIVTIIILLVTLNTMLMAVTERSREIGTMRAIGMQQGSVVRLFCIEGGMMAVIGCILALPLLYGISGLLTVLKVTFIPPVASAPIPIMLILGPEKLVGMFALFLTAAVFSSYLTSRNIAKKKIVDSLAHIN